MRQLSLFFFLIVCGLIIFSCNNFTQKKFEFFYYPSKNVYYDVTNSMYLYSLDDGKTWDSLNIKTDKDPATLGEKQIIYSTSPEIWLENEQHRNQYNAKTINIITNDSSDITKNLAAERKIKKAIPQKTEEKKPEKKRNLFQRIFGKKNKD